MKLFKTGLLVVSFLGLCLTSGRAQEVALKTNLLYWGTTTPNLSVEFGTGTRTSLDIMGSYNPFTFGSHEANRKLKHWIVQPEFRLWKCEKFNRGFWGFHAMYGQYNVGNWNLPFDLFPGLKNYRYQGYLVGAGVSYGWQWYLGPHWNLEATFGFGYAYMNYKRYDCARCGEYLGKGKKHYWGPTRIGVSFVYLFKSKK